MFSGVIKKLIFIGGVLVCDIVKRADYSLYWNLLE